MEKTKKQKQKPKIDPGPGYRLLKVGEVIQVGDEFTMNSGDPEYTWTPTGDAGRKLESDDLLCRRKIDAPAKPEPAKPAKPANPQSALGYKVEIWTAGSWLVFRDIVNLTQDYRDGFHVLTFTETTGRDVEVVTRETVVITPVQSV